MPVAICQGRAGSPWITVIAIAALGRCVCSSATAPRFPTSGGITVTSQAMGARCAVAADFDGDGRKDLVSASSNDNAVSWFQNLGPVGNTGRIEFSIKKQITWSSLGSRIVTVADIDGDGDVDVVGASYYDSTVRWFENAGPGKKGDLEFIPHVVSTAVNEGQGVTVADFDNDGDADIATASSGDNTVAVFTNVDHGIFCDMKQVVDNNATGVRTVVAADLDGDGFLDLASASKDDHSVSWYPNLGGVDAGVFKQKITISQGADSKGAYSLVAADIDKDGDNDLIVASNGNDRVTLWRNLDGKGNFEKTVIYDNADFVLSVTAVDFDRDGDIDVASASFFDGYIRWYENLDGQGMEWKNHTIYHDPIAQGHYVAHADMDDDGDDDLIAVTHAENTVRIWLAATGCDSVASEDCCATGTEWNGTSCSQCEHGTYGVGEGAEAKCVACPKGCIIEGLKVVPATCSGITGCASNQSIAACACPENSVKDLKTDTCVVCPEGQERPGTITRGVDTIGNYSAWELQQGVCTVISVYNYRPLLYSLVAVAVLAIICAYLFWRRLAAVTELDEAWTIALDELSYDDPVVNLGTGSFGVVVKGYYRGTAVAIKKAVPVHAVRRVSSQGLGLGLETAASAANTGTGTANLSNTIQSWRQNKTNNGSFNRSWNRRESWCSVDSSGQLGSTQDLVNKQPDIVTRALSTKGRTSFIREMRTLAKLRHPCITTIMGAVREKEMLLVMEYMEKGSLRDLLSNKTFPLDPELSLPLLRDILQGMRFLHSANPPIVHGDLKCANVLVDENFRAKIADFGLSGKRDSGYLGTPFWMAPELLKGANISTASDVYAFGVTLWELMTHKIPYEDVTMPIEEIIKSVKEGKLRPDCSEGLDKELVECMQSCWAQEADARPKLEDLELKLIPLCGQNFFSVMQERNKRTKQQSRLLEDVFPEHIAKDLLAGKKVEPQQHDCVTIYFSDIVGFTTISEKLSAQEVSAMLDRLYIAFDELAEQHGVFKLETIGDAWVGACNLTQTQADHAARIARFSIDAVRAAQSTPIDPSNPALGNVKIRVGFHSGPVVSSVVGTKNPRYCLFGDTMNTSSRMESTSEELRIHASEDAHSLASQQDANLKFTYRGKTAIKGKGKMHTYWLEDTGAPYERSTPSTITEVRGPSKVDSGSAEGPVTDAEVAIEVGTLEVKEEITSTLSIGEGPSKV